MAKSPKGKTASPSKITAEDDSSSTYRPSNQPRHQPDEEPSAQSPLRMEYWSAPQRTKADWVRTLSSKARKSDSAILNKVDQGHFHDFLLVQAILSPTAETPSAGPTPEVEPGGLESQPVEEVGPASTVIERRVPAPPPSVQTVNEAPQDDPELYMFTFGGPGPSNSWDTVVITEDIVVREYLGIHPGMSVYLSALPHRVLCHVQDLSRGGKGLAASDDIPTGTRIVLQRPLLVTTQRLEYTTFVKLDKLFESSAPETRRALLELLNGPNRLTPLINDTMTVVERLGYDIRFFMADSKPYRAVFQTISRCRRQRVDANARFKFHHSTFCGELWSTRHISAGEEVFIS